MITNRKLYARASALPAIAAALALSSTPLLAQEAQPVPSDPPPATTAEPATAPESTPVTTETTTTTTQEPVATEAAPVATKTTKTTKTVRTSRGATAKPTAAPRMSTTHTVTRETAPAAAAPAAPPPAQTQQSQSAVAPVVDMNANPSTRPTTTAQSTKSDETLPIAAGGALALLALGGAGIALAKRRRRHQDEESAEDEHIEHEAVEPVAREPEAVIHEEQPAIVAPSAFAWGNQPSEPTRSNAQTVDDDDRMPGESWVQRAYRGPTPNNPSVSLRARLKRAAFFDKREREVAAGTAEPVDMDAGLPEAMVDEQERELA